MNCENIRSRPALFDRGRPEKAGKSLPQLAVKLLVRFKARQEMALAHGGQSQYRLVLEHLSVWLGGIKDYWNQVTKRAVRKS